MVCVPQESVQREYDMDYVGDPSSGYVLCVFICACVCTCMHAVCMCNMKRITCTCVVLVTGRSKTKLRIRRLTSPHTSPGGHR